ncbi:type III secretion system export apparatus subunit SctV [Steroidobacter agaridevorans]|uniref:type III secretion system export apparatus subunit SctV n=1 Tax=Steroidobacter agaridevorans TaxID=2695856 RepID=UPI00132C3E49|nr:type III secretion system export apparatus subunit SctV [Steroidobacter agaridevorans]GFE85236.1 EscV/YscV/HrcV family type III secretion system export apparatus protein [Steroidobacter agaridevorans]
MSAIAKDIRNSIDWRTALLQSNVLLTAIIVAAIGMMILPLSPFMLDLLIAVNLSMSLLLLLVSLYVGSPLGLSTFPSLLLFTTLFRLALNIASTRQILMHAHAGDIIFTFGNLVVGGDIIVGVVVFLIIAIVQFVVIAKGAERVAEVGARFTLDAMPGKQMSIDADLRAGLIDKDEARLRRSRLERESHLYGAMDGAMKFVKGDAIAALIIAAVNIVAGLAIGTLRKGMDLDHALQTYATLTVGDALVSQIPSLLVSIAAGILITRVSDPSKANNTGLGDEIAGQLQAHPRALLIGSAVILALVLVPGFPKVPFLVLAILIGATGFALLPHRRRYKQAGDRPMPVMRREGSDLVRPWIDSSDRLLAVPLSVDVFATIDRHLRPEALESELRQIRRAVETDLGVPFPGIVMRRVPDLAEGAYRICIHEIPIAHGELRVDHLLAVDGPELLLTTGSPRSDGDNRFWGGRPAAWVSVERKSQLDVAQRPYLTLEQVLARHVLHVLRQHADEFIGIQETQLLLKRLADEYPDLERELQRNIPVPRLSDVLKRLVREEISIRNLREIAHALVEWAPREKDTTLVTEYVRTSLARYISYRFTKPDGTLTAVVLHPTLEDRLRQSLRQTSAGSVLMLDPQTRREIVNKLRNSFAAREPHEIGRAPTVLLTSLEIRPHLRKLIEPELGRIAVLSYQELEATVRIDPVESVS